MVKDYTKAKIYKIVSASTDDVYYGSTCKTLKRRLSVHKGVYKLYLNGKCNHIRSFDILKHNDHKIVLVENFPCNDNHELMLREGYYIMNFECINHNVPGRTKKEYSKAYHEKNKDVLNTKKRENFTCNCGGKYTRSGKTQHEKTKKHQKYIQNQNITYNITNCNVTINN